MLRRVRPDQSLDDFVGEILQLALGNSEALERLPAPHLRREQLAEL
jgi:hypothetical protein